MRGLAFEIFKLEACGLLVKFPGEHESGMGEEEEEGINRNIKLEAERQKLRQSEETGRQQGREKRKEAGKRN